MDNSKMNKKQKICFIANNGGGKKPIDGERGKTRAYLNAFKKEKADILLVDLYQWKRHPFRLYCKIKNSIKKCDIIVLMAASKGTRVLIPLINRFNAKRKKRFIYSFIGLGPLSKVVSSLNETTYKLFMDCKFKPKMHDRWFANELKKVDVLLAETDIVKDVMKYYYNSSNCFVLNNFRDCCLPKASSASLHTPISIVFYSRVRREKGVFDLLESVQALNETERIVTLDIYGPLQLNDEDKKIFDTFLSRHDITYKGVLDMNCAVETLSRYRLMCFPTRYKTEGVPGALTDALLAGIPILSSYFPQILNVITPGYDCISYSFLDKNDLINKMTQIVCDKAILETIKSGVVESRKRFTYDYCRNDFLSFIYGK